MRKRDPSAILAKIKKSQVESVVQEREARLFARTADCIERGIMILASSGRIVLLIFIALLHGHACNDSAQTDSAIETVNSKQQDQLAVGEQHQQLTGNEYLVGAGIADITGPAADINLMGYAKPNQDAGGIHLRQFSRAIVIEDKHGGRVLYINLDSGMVSQLLRTNVLNTLKQQYGPNMFNETNVMLTGGFFQYMLYNIPSAGFISQTLTTLTDGIVRSVERAVASVKPAKIYMNKGELLDASVNRSPTAYANNPAEERATYKHDTDKEMFLLRIVDRNNHPLAMLNWFPVHGTSMNNTNHLISSDNKGYAALLFENDYNPSGTLPGKGKFVAIFAQANEGDVSGNTRGPRCIDTGLPCDAVTSTCGNPPRNEKCIAFGPGRDMFESTQIIAYKQYYKAKRLFEDTSDQKQVRGPVRHVHQHIDMTQQVVPPYESAALVLSARQRRRAERQQHIQASLTGGKRWRNNNVERQELAQMNATEPYRTCKAALGYSFAAGTTDGPGAFDFQQGDTVSTRYWNMVRDFIKRPSEDSVKCHHPKPILLATGQMDFPYMWHPKVVPTQIFMIGQVAIVGLPGEFTTMAGRRIREAVRRALTNPKDPLLVDEAKQVIAARIEFLRRSTEKASVANQAEKLPPIEVVLSGLSNIYSSYITTVEEYEIQRYEGASTLYGPHTLQAYINQFERLANNLLHTQQPDDSLNPPDLTKSLFTLKPGVLFDGAPHGTNFGSVLHDADTVNVYKPQERVLVSFVAGNPRNNPRHEDSFLYVERFDVSNRNWTIVATDASWETKFIWERTNTLFGESRATIEWTIPVESTTGIYRIRHLGASKSLLQQTLRPYYGTSSPFKVATPGDQASEERLEIERQLAEQYLQQERLLNGDESGSIQRQAGCCSDEQQRRRSFANIFMAPLHYLGSIFRPSEFIG